MAVGTEVRAITYNLCGAAAHCDNPGEIDDRTGYLIDEVLLYDADVVTLTEVCYLQYTHIRDELAAHGYQAAWKAIRPEIASCTPPGGNTEQLAAANKLRFGMVTLAKGTLANREEITLTPTNYGTSAVSKALCHDLNISGFAAGEIRGCVAHLRSGADGAAARARWAQSATWAAELDRYLLGNDQVVILGGDLNAEPADPELSPLYALEGVGAFAEVGMTDSAHFTAGCIDQQATECRSGEPTFDHPVTGPKKIDYIFFSADHADALNDVVRPGGPNSDHDLLRGSASITP
jgi:endonuclease/exonuclease/phosphatase family metal-dependent hydrolase